MAKKEFTKAFKASFLSFFMGCGSGGHPEIDSPDDAVSVASDDSILAGFVSIREPTPVTKAIAQKFAPSGVSLCSLFRSLCCFKLSRQKVDDSDDVVSVASGDSIPSHFSNERASTISPARAACRNEKPDPKAGAFLNEGARTGRRASDSSSEDCDAVVRKVVITYACVHSVDDVVNDREILV